MTMVRRDGGSYRCSFWWRCWECGDITNGKTLSWGGRGAAVSTLPPTEILTQCGREASRLVIVGGSQMHVCGVPHANPPHEFCTDYT